tara:strand:- start:1296 stop:1817 length:522 start_codon:yes stop_codon:yes gene_type:complete
MKRKINKINGLFVVNGRAFKDKRGWLREAFKKKIIGKDLIFSIISKSNKNVLRGLHLQKKNQQDKFIVVLKGKILDVAVDLRKKSKTFGKHFKIILSDKNCKGLFIPNGFAHGFLGIEKENIVLYGCSKYRNKKSEVSIRWNDPTLNINWGIKRPVLSEKDKNALTLDKFLKF